MPSKPKTFGIIANTQMPRVWEVLPDFLKWIESQGPTVLVCDDLKDRLKHPKTAFLPADELAQASDMILSFGGDGTMLSTARKVGRYQIPILGVNLGGLGYLAEISLADLHPRIQELLDGCFRIEDRMVLKCWVEGSDEEVFALNDIVISKGSYPRVVSIRTTIEKRYLNTYTGDGLIIATPTGSTAYSLSAGGPIVEPCLHTIIISPISPHTLADRPVVIGADKTVEALIVGRNDSLTLVADGEYVRLLTHGNRVFTAMADYSVKLVLFDNKYFYDVLREKLKWGPPRNTNDSEN